MFIISMRVKKDKYYVIINNKNHVQGAFPFTDEGKAQAKKYLKKINKMKEYHIEER
tara:strand:+ start:255 stop:422 length:168 start_codon:yes stop_codon:yes gene_type:complete